MPGLEIKHFAQIEDASLQFGDLTVLVGPQATGKSLVLQLLKYALDRPIIARRLKMNGLDWDAGSRHGLLAAFLGEGYETAFSPATEITFNGRPVLSDKKERSSARDPKVFFVPAQRVLALSNGWPRPFSNFEPGDPYVMRQFSQDVLEQFGRGLGRGNALIFPQPDRLTAPIRQSIEDSIFHGGKLSLKSEGGRKRLVIRYPGRQTGHETVLPFLEWSAGQREFAPLLLGLYQLLPSGKISAHASYEWAVIEEPEMGLHPNAINSVMLLVFELVCRGYKVCLSTHSPYVLELLWALQTLRRSRSSRRVPALLEALQLKASMTALARTLLDKVVRVHALTFEKQVHRCADISDLDLDSADHVKAGWGGVTALSAAVSRAVARSY